MSVGALWRWLTSQTLRGLLLLVPLVVTVIFIVWLSRTIESSLKPLFEVFLPSGWYVPGLALVLFLLCALILGLLTRNVLMRKLVIWTERWMIKLPVVGSIYPVVRQLTDLFSGKNQSQGGSVVLVTFTETGAQAIGIVTRPAETMQLPWLAADHDLVYIPMSYQMGGFTLVLPRSQLQPLSMKPGEALQMVMMGGMVQPKPAATPGV
ncbi:MAG: hypothetical protein JWM78_60 [Verrucomicrobiaceae bacterium]|nr:hypothetical protein [Verrucomicrobiaceae bacterium]